MIIKRISFYSSVILYTDVEIIDFNSDQICN